MILTYLTYLPPVRGRGETRERQGILKFRDMYIGRYDIVRLMTGWKGRKGWWCQVFIRIEPRSLQEMGWGMDTLSPAAMVPPTQSGVDACPCGPVQYLCVCIGFLKLRSTCMYKAPPYCV